MGAAALVRSHLRSVQCDRSSQVRCAYQVESGSPRGRLSEATFSQLSDGSSSLLPDAGSMSGSRGAPRRSCPFRQHVQQTGLIVKQGGSRLRSFAFARSLASVFYQLLNERSSDLALRMVAVLTIR